MKVDEKAGICIITCTWSQRGSPLFWHPLVSYVCPDAHCEYDNGYLVFDRDDRSKEVWRLVSGFTTDDEVAAYAPPEAVQIAVSAHAASLNHQYAPRGHFRPWGLLRFHEPARGYRLAYPTLICASRERAFLYDVHTGSLVQTIAIRFWSLSNLDVNERHAFVCESDAMHVFSRESGNEVLCIPVDASVQCSRRVEDPFLISGDWLITPLSVHPEVDESRDLSENAIAAHVSRDGRDLVVLSVKRRVMFIRDFERICRGETSLEQIRGLYVFTFGADLSARAAFVRPSENALARSYISCMQLTDRRIYFTWEDSRRRQDITLFEDAENAQELPRPITPIFDLELQVMLWMAQHAPVEKDSATQEKFKNVQEIQLRVQTLLPSPKLGRLLYALGLPVWL
ncbi:hypothetical protein EDB86DRAFT_2825674 [Lactarius hatsudake]|nr:hypothetical protein EDB86DRAFT_2825674 [Lactarius hatsudake]